MSIKNFCCSLVTCEQCTKHTLVRKNYFNDKIYVCSAFPSEHTAIRGTNCGAFRCDVIHKSPLLCDICKQKEYTKVLKK